MGSKLNKEDKDIILALLAMVGIVAVVALAGFALLRKGPEIIQGEVEVSEFRVSGKLPARILKLLKKEGDMVQEGDTLVLLEAPDVEAKLDQAQAAQDAAQALKQKASGSAREEQVQAAWSVWQKALAGKDVAEKTYNRVKRLHEEGVIATQKLDEAKAQYLAAEATEQAAKAQYTMAVNGAEQQDRAAAAAQVERARGAVSEVNAYLAETCLTAPCSGQVSEVYPNPGELVGSGAPIMSIAMTGEQWVTFNVREDLLRDMTLGTTITAKIPALGDKEVEVTIYYLKDLGTYAAWKATRATGQYDLKTFEVRARLKQPVDGLHAGMSVIVER